MHQLRSLTVAIVVMASLIMVAGVARAQSSPSVSVTPSSGTQDTTFSFTGNGFAAGAVLAELYVDPNGQQYTFYDSAGNATVIVAGDDGSFSVDVLPRTDFQGGAPGTWTVIFCTSSGDCFSGTIDISL